MFASNKAFKVEIPQLHPLSASYLSFWREQKQRCIEGYWVGGTYMPPALYFYINFGTIKKNVKPHLPKTFERPDLRDIDWELFRLYTEARGFSGFELDEEYTSHRALLDPTVDDELLRLFYPSTLKADGTRKTYRTARETLFMIHPHSLGKALFENQIQNFMVMGSRNFGKSYSVGAGIIPHNFLFDGATSYDEHTIANPATVEILVGAEESSRSRDLLSKTKESFDFLPGKIELNHRTYPSPFSKQTIGSMEVNRDYVAAYKKRDPGGWTLAGSKSAIKHRSFNANPFAAQGTRPLLLVLEEIGLFSNLKEAYYHSVDALRSGTTKSGMLFMIGTGGDMGKGTLHAQEMFYSPEKFEILSMPNTFEPNGKGDIAYFVPAYLTLGPEYRDAELNTKVELAKAYLMQQRDKKRTDKGGSQALNMEMQYRPFVPSEMFLSRTASIFPSAELRRRASEVLASDLYSKVEKRVSLFFDPTTPIYNGVNYEIDDRLEPITAFPTPEEANKEGSVVVYELPYVDPQTARVPQDAYIIGCDPFKEDNPMKGGSLAAIYVVKTSKHFNTVGHDEIVASYVGRPYAGKNAVNEILYKLSLFYGNAKIYFENSVGNVKDYFEKQKRLDLLASQPTTIFNRKASYATPQSVIYGYPMSNDKIKWEAIQYLRSWLLEERDPETHVRNLDLITDPALLQELLAFDMDGNFDRVMSLTGCIIGLEEFHNHSKRRTENENANSALNIEFKSFIVNNKNLFNVSTSTPLLPSQSR